MIVNVKKILLLAGCIFPLLSPGQLHDDNKRGLNGLPEVPFESLSDTTLSTRGKAALEVSPETWKHGETDHFVYHFQHGFTATQVSIESEFHYRIFAKELGKDTSEWERKCHIFIFEDATMWDDFKKHGGLDPWTGGFHAAGELFFYRNPKKKFKGRVLGHEISHLVFYRFYGSGIPLWLNEGFAEYISARSYASYYRARGYISRPHASAINPENFIPLEELLGASSYPEETEKVHIFYDQSTRLVWFLCKESKTKFLEFLDGMSKGNKFETAMFRSYGGRFPSIESLEKEFKVYATKDYEETDEPE